MKVKSLSRVRLFATPWTAAHQAPLSMGFSRQEYWSGVPLYFPNSLWMASGSSVSCFISDFGDLFILSLYLSILLKVYQFYWCLLKYHIFILLISPLLLCFKFCWFLLYIISLLCFGLSCFSSSSFLDHWFWDHFSIKNPFNPF